MKKELKSHVINLYMLALSDGDFAKEELDVILKIAEDKGFSREEFEIIVSNPLNVEFHLPNNFIERIKLLFDFVKVILADDVIAEEEESMFMRFCEKFQFNEEESKELFDWLVNLAKRDLPTDLLDEEIKKIID